MRQSFFLCTVALVACQDSVSPGDPIPPDDLAYGSVTRGTCSSLWAAWGDAANDVLGQYVIRVGDIDEDGVEDLAATLSRSGTPARIRLLSGKTGGEIRTFSVPADSVFSLTATGDLDDDGVPDLAMAGARETDSTEGDVSIPGYVQELVLAVSGATGLTLWEQAGDPNARFALSVAAGDDVNDDGAADLLFGHIGPDALVGEVRILNAKTGALLDTIPPPHDSDSFGTRAAAMGDLNGDAAADYFVTDAYGPTTDFALGIGMAVSGADDAVLWAQVGRRGSGALAAEQPSFFGNVITPTPADLNGDGVLDLVVAAHVQYVDDVGKETGEVTALAGDTGEILWRLPGTRELELFGVNVTFVGDINGDAVMDVLVGAPQHFGSDLVLGGVGRAVVVSGHDGSVLVEVGGVVKGADLSDGLGLAGDSLGADVDGDGRADFVLSAYRADAGDAKDTGVVFALSCAP